jgi:hypothetical protein
MSHIGAVCEDCPAQIKAIFDPAAGTRLPEYIAGDLHVTDQCFVRDEIHFIDQGRLVFDPAAKGEYKKEYFVICRKLVVRGGHQPPTRDPCGPDDPGQAYKGNNVITWKDRLHAAAAGADQLPVANAQPKNRYVWSDTGHGDNGAEGDPGDAGNKGNPGKEGMSAPTFTLLALEVDLGDGLDIGHLTIDFNGQSGGQGGRGQKGGDGGDGMGGREGESDTSWPGKGCDRQPGRGGNGGRGGDGGDGGDGAAAGNAGNIFIISTKKNISGTGAFVSGHISYVNDGATGGEGDQGGLGGKGGLGGFPGDKSSLCDKSDPGLPGAEGVSHYNINGQTGAPGNPGTLNFEEIPAKKCADPIPLPIKIDGLDPTVYCRGSSTPAVQAGTLTGENLSQVSGAETDLLHVTVTIKPTSDDTHLDLKFAIAGNSALAPGQLILTRDFGDAVKVPIEVRRFEVTGIAPNTGARGQTVAVTITGGCFDPNAVIQQVIVSGTGVTVQNVAVLDENTINCTFDISQLATQNVRDVTVKLDTFHYTLANAFTVT